MQQHVLSMLPNAIPMFDEIKRFMQQKDPNGTWEEAPDTPLERAHMLDTLLEWVEGGMDETSKVLSYVYFLRYRTNEWK